MEKEKYILLFEKYLRNEASEEEKERLLTMLRRDKYINQLLEKGLENSESEFDEEIINRMYENIRTTVFPSKKSTRKLIQPVWRKAMQWVAIIMLPVLSAFLAYYITINQTYNNNNNVTVTAGNGEKADIMLADGSHVWINSGSSLTYNEGFNRKERNVYLEGEAYFEVAKDAERPFIVRTGEMDIQALGTAFNVNAYNDERYVSSVLLEGKIKVIALGQEHILTENERVTIDRSLQTLSTDKVYASDFVQWKDGNIYFENRSFEEIANTLSRVFNVEIRFASNSLRPIRFSGTLGNSSIRNAMDILSLTSPMYYEMNGTVIELYYKE